LQVIRADRSLRYAQQSESNIKRQTSLESARMEAGRGYATDVLQAKAQLAGAEARRVIAESRMREASNRFRAVFGEAPVDVGSLQAVSIPESLLPRSEAEITDIINQQNPDVVAADGRAEVTLAERDVQRARELMPRLALQLNQIHYKDYDGIKGDRDDTKAMVRFDWAFDLGMKAARVTEAADQSVISAREKAAYVRIQALEEGRNAWVGWQTARERTNYLINQAQISGNFLDWRARNANLVAAPSSTCSTERSPSSTPRAMPPRPGGRGDCRLPAAPRHRWAQARGRARPGRGDPGREAPALHHRRRFQGVFRQLSRAHSPRLARSPARASHEERPGFSRPPNSRPQTRTSSAGVMLSQE
jgi:hypothetical protein